MDTVTKDPVGIAMELLGHKGLAREEGRRSCQALGFFIQTINDEVHYRFLLDRGAVPYSRSFDEDMSSSLAEALEGDLTPKNEAFLQDISALVEDSPLNPHELLDVLFSYEYVRNIWGSEKAQKHEALYYMKGDKYVKELIDRLYPDQGIADVVPKLDNLSRDLKELIESRI